MAVLLRFLVAWLVAVIIIFATTPSDPGSDRTLYGGR